MPPSRYPASPSGRPPRTRRRSDARPSARPAGVARRPVRGGRELRRAPAARHRRGDEGRGRRRRRCHRPRRRARLREDHRSRRAARGERRSLRSRRDLLLLVVRLPQGLRDRRAGARQAAPRLDRHRRLPPQRAPRGFHAPGLALRFRGGGRRRAAHGPPGARDRLGQAAAPARARSRRGGGRERAAARRLGAARALPAGGAQGGLAGRDLPLARLSLRLCVLHGTREARHVLARARAAPGGRGDAPPRPLPRPHHMDALHRRRALRHEGLVAADVPRGARAAARPRAQGLAARAPRSAGARGPRAHGARQRVAWFRPRVGRSRAGSAHPQGGTPLRLSRPDDARRGVGPRAECTVGRERHHRPPRRDRAQPAHHREVPRAPLPR